MLDTIAVPTTDCYYNQLTETITCEDSIDYINYVKDGICKGLTVDKCYDKLNDIANKELISSIPTNKKQCELMGFIWQDIKEFPQIPSYPKSHCEPIYNSVCSTSYDGQEPVSAKCWWDNNQLNKLGRNKLVRDLITKYNNLYKHSSK